jgi:NAD(P)H dehydrogenase (quinone)
LRLPFGKFSEYLELAMIVVTGASGQLGRAIVEALVRRVPAAQVGASCREPEKASALSALGVRVRKGDFDDVASLAQAFEGATQVLMVSSNARAYGGDAIAQHRTAIEAARRAGARRLIYTSHMAASASSQFPPMLDHAATEAMLAESGLAWTALRHGFYATSGLALLGDAKNTGLIEAPADGKVSWTAHADLADAAAAILAKEGSFDGATPPLTGSEALDLADLAEAASKAWGRPVRRELISEDELRARIAKRGLPPVVGEMSVGLYRASRAGEFAAIDPTLERLIGRAPMRVGSILR